MSALPFVAYDAMLGPKGEPRFAHWIQHYIEQRLRQYVPDQPPREANRVLIDLKLRYASFAGSGNVVGI